VQSISTPNAPTPAGHYSQAVSHDGVLFVSAQLPLDPQAIDQGNQGTVAEQAERALRNIQAVIEAAGACMRDVIRLTAYVSDIASWGEVNAVCERLFGDHRPARAVVPTGPLHFGYSVAFDAVVSLDGNSVVAATADLCDEYGDLLQVTQPGLRSYGGRWAFSGLIETVQVSKDNTAVRRILSEPGEGRVLVVDGGGLPVALVGDRLAGIAVEHGWTGIVINGYVRDTSALRGLPIGVLALGAFPKRSFASIAGKQSIEVEFLGVTFRPGTWLCTDSDGLVLAPEPPTRRRELDEGQVGS